MVKKHPSLLGLKVYANKNPGLPVIIGDMDEHELGAAGTQDDADVIAHGSIFYMKLHKAVEITLPLRDRNGDIAAAVKIRMKSFLGETQDNAVGRATLLKKEIEQQIETVQSING
jgi:hypothetical protein